MWNGIPVCVGLLLLAAPFMIVQGAPGDGTQCEQAEVDVCATAGLHQCEGGFRHAQGCPDWRATYEPSPGDFLEDTAFDAARGQLYLMPDWEGRKVIAADAADGTELWTATFDDDDLWGFYPEFLELLPNGTLVMAAEISTADGSGLAMAMVYPDGTRGPMLVDWEDDDEWFYLAGFAVSSDGRYGYLAGEEWDGSTGTGEIHVAGFDLVSGQELFSVNDRTTGRVDSNHYAVELSADGSQLLVATADPARVVAYDTDDGSIQWTHALEEGLAPVDLAVLGDRAAVVAEADDALKVVAWTPGGASWTQTFAGSTSYAYAYGWGDRDYLVPYDEDTLLFAAPGQGEDVWFALDAETGVITGQGGLGFDVTGVALGGITHRGAGTPIYVYGAAPVDRLPALSAIGPYEWDGFVSVWTPDGMLLETHWADGVRPLFDDDVTTHLAVEPDGSKAYLMGHTGDLFAAGYTMDASGA